ncbi:G-protein coupled receptor 157-like isoform X2 [Dreissena polymorpha]|uniref:G-protein coupled receptors family 2 profile 2 domain-containing protein n=1 Tax=Dreissena polymorpha TaxID=45954 RepID=A0A9D4EMK3_DREPO|nr:G-protein coupled receptor 157-like isoform X2 [Dreissena polymorpha]XP_052226994.1 G-protein coupled receptor 157-like isoform X2 [Dreissena polymorpha]XP_052226997.1 G-protein coupled receptor 157-like isoform X2 [Dreissena polymorpha]XP_052226998.1 G-protein coupled receptor 157-like isoform X2 [Dreissena polymorpha]XP_052226999.1 G-protein coupled receptor 157-like isoform X2 [Dreissena polymorpha]XP_052227000.1 G-protein coupled receptor 157-like isoform X2 [Dreissena polymorpha]KAH37
MPSSSVNNTYVIPDYVIICTFISCGLSLIGCMGLLATYIRVSIIRNYIRQLLMFLTLANFIHVCADMTGMFMYVSMRSYNDSTNRYYARFDEMCVTQGLMSSYAPMVEFLWSTVIAVYFHANVLHTSVHQQFATTRSKLISHCCCWIIPAIVCAFGLYYGVFGETRDLFISPGCWIDTDYLSKNDQILWMMLTKIGLECVTFLVVTEVAVFTGWKLLILPIWKPGTRPSQVWGRV